MTRLAILCPLLLVACHIAPVAAPASKNDGVVVTRAEGEPVLRHVERRETNVRDRELLEAAKGALNRAIKRLDWLNGRDPGT